MARWVSWAVSRSASAARRPAVSPSWSLWVISTDTPGGGDTVSSRAATDAALLETVSPPPGVSVLITNNDHDGLTAGLRAAEADLDTAQETHRAIPARLPLGQVAPGQQVLDIQTKLITHAIRIAAFNTATT